MRQAIKGWLILLVFPSGLEFFLWAKVIMYLLYSLTRVYQKQPGADNQCSCVHPHEGTALNKTKINLETLKHTLTLGVFNQIYLT